jgi:C1A family cysteine protease
MKHLHEQFGSGWIPDYPDFRDYGEKHKEISKMISKAGLKKSENKILPNRVDLRDWCPPIENQGKLNSCTAHAGASLFEYFQKRAYGKHMDVSRLFLYKVTRKLLNWDADNGAFLRTTMGAMVLFGVPPEEYWPYKEKDVNKEPPPFCYAFAQNFQALKYLRLDPPNEPKEASLRRIKSYLAAGFPSMFGFTMFNSLTQALDSGEIPFPHENDRKFGGHALVAVGYDDSYRVKNWEDGGPETMGAFLIRNSWGLNWGQRGYGWLPYYYVIKGLAVDWWSLISSEWIDTGKFKL